MAEVYRMVFRRVLLFGLYIVISLGTMIVISGNIRGSSGPVFGFMSWGFVFARLAAKTLPMVLLIYISYWWVIIWLNTLVAYLDKAHGPVLPILVHCVGTFLAVIGSGRLLPDEGGGSLLLYFSISLIISIAYVLADWRLTLDFFRRRRRDKNGRHGGLQSD